MSFELCVICQVEDRLLFVWFDLVVVRCLVFFALESI